MLKDFTRKSNKRNKGQLSSNKILDFITISLQHPCLFLSNAIAQKAKGIVLTKTAIFYVNMS